MADKDQQREQGNQAAQTTATQDNRDARFGIQRIYVKDASFESPDSPETFRKTYNPQVNFSINNRSTKIEDNIYEVVLRLTADVKQEEKTVFLVEVQQAGIFEISGIQGEQLERALTVGCPTILFPYGREAMDALVVKGSFPALMIAPINFESIYLQARKNQAEQQAAQKSSPAVENTDSQETH